MLGEDAQAAKEIAIAILLHTEKLKPLQQVVALSDEADKEAGGNHQYKQIDILGALERIRTIDAQISHEYKKEKLRVSEW